MPSKITLKLINDERKSRRILSAKACGANYTDEAKCNIVFASDSCGGIDLEACVNASDICKYIERASCHGPGAYDKCDYDYIVDCSGSDICSLDRVPCYTDS